MKFFHLSDLHIGLKLMNRDLKEDQEYILRQITEAAVKEKPDAVVIAGDIYDKAVPSSEAVKIFDGFIGDLASALPDISIMLISGNHDSGPRLNCFRSILQRQNVHMIGIPPETPEDHIEKVVLEDEYGKINFYLLPFVRPSMVSKAVISEEDENALSYDETVRRLIEREHIDVSQRNVLVSHQFYLPSGKSPDDIERMDSEIRTVGNIDQVNADILQPFDYCALGHIHKPMKLGNDYCRYCGTPLACSVSEAGQQKSIVMAELGEKGDRRVTLLPLRPLRQIRVIKGTFEEVLSRGCPDYVTVILTDKADLDFFDMQDRLKKAFDNLLEIRRLTEKEMNYSFDYEPDEDLEPFDLCCSFLELGDGDEEKKELLRDVINSAREDMMR